MIPTCLLFFGEIIDKSIREALGSTPPVLFCCLPSSFFQVFHQETRRWMTVLILHIIKCQTKKKNSIFFSNLIIFIKIRIYISFPFSLKTTEEIYIIFSISFFSSLYVICYMHTLCRKIFSFAYLIFSFALSFSFSLFLSASSMFTNFGGENK